jgi:hypothetical protein
LSNKSRDSGVFPETELEKVHEVLIEMARQLEPHHKAYARHTRRDVRTTNASQSASGTEYRLPVASWNLREFWYPGSSSAFEIPSCKPRIDRCTSDLTFSIASLVALC